jgi:hypothetical protein
MPQDHPVFYLVVAVLLVAGVFRYAIVKKHRGIDDSFGISRRGGRDGYLEYRVGDQLGRVEWEMLVREFDFVVYVQTLSWFQPESRAFTVEERQRFLETLDHWAKARHLKFKMYDSKSAA